MIGPAGAGKSTLVRRLVDGPHPAAATRAVRMGLWGQPLAVLAVHAARLVATGAAAWRGGERLSWAELTQMVRVSSLGDSVRRARGNLIVLDEGPVFALSWFEVFFPERVGRAAFARWRAATIERWARTLDAVVLLDAPDPVLADRIRRRAKPHMVKALPDAEISRFNDRFRVAFDRVLRDLTSAGGPTVVSCRMRGNEPEEVLVAGVLAAVEGTGHGC